MRHGDTIDLTVLEAMGNLATDAEADAASDILRERGYERVTDVPEEEWLTGIIPEAVRRAAVQ